jgi:hypothetical protein
MRVRSVVGDPDFCAAIAWVYGLFLPMAVLLATLISYSRLSSDGEITALRSCGVSVYRLVVSAIVLSLLFLGSRLPLMK